MGCCDDPTEPEKISRSDWVLLQEQYGNLQRDLFTGDPEKVMLKTLQSASTYLQELAALRAHYDSVRQAAIRLLNKESLNVLQRIAEQESDSDMGAAARQRIAELENDTGLFGRLFHSE